MPKNLRQNLCRNQNGTLYVELLIAIALLAVFGAVVMSYITQHQRLQQLARVRDTANYTANAAARLYKANFCPSGTVVPGNGTVVVSEQGIKLFVLPDTPAAGTPGQTFLFRATSSRTPTGGNALSFELVDQFGKSITVKIIPI